MIHYRKIIRSDFEEIRNLGILSWNKFSKILTPSNWDLLRQNVESPETYLEILNTSEGIAATNDSKMVGMIYLVPNGNPTEIYDSAWCYIRFLSVLPQYNGQGIGRNLTEMIIDLARKNGEKTLALHTSETMPNARRLYENLGFTIKRELPQRFGVRYFLYTMEL